MAEVLAQVAGGKNCGLCGTSTDGTTAKRKRKLLHGRNSLKELSILNANIRRKHPGQSVYSFKELRDPSTVLCVQCKKLLLDQKDAQDNLRNITQKIDAKLSSLRSAISANAGAGTGQKRSQQPEDSDSESSADNEPSQANASTQSTTPTRFKRVTVNYTYRSGLKKARNIYTPKRQETVVSMSRKSDKAASVNIVSFSKTKDYTMNAVVLKMRCEMTKICSTNCKTILREGDVKEFSWKKVWTELKRHVPTLVSFFCSLLPKTPMKFLCFIICAILKRRCMHMALVQRIISIMLYSNGTNKEVYNCLQPFMICVAPSTTTKLIDSIASCYDANVKLWVENEKKTLSPSSESYELVYDPFEGLFSDEENIFDDSDEESIIDEYPVSDMWTDLEEEPSDSDEEHGEYDANGTQTGRQEESEQGQDNVDQEVRLGVNRNQRVIEIQDQEAMVEESHSRLESMQGQEVLPEEMLGQGVQIEDHREIDCGNSEILSPSVSNESSGQGNQADNLGVPTGPCQVIKPPHYGYTLTIDNIDMNVRRSFQRLDRTTQSYHFCHVYAALNRMDSAMLEYGHSSGVISLETVLPSIGDVEKVLEDFNVLVSRVLVQHLSMCSDQQALVDWHISSNYSKEMSQASTVMPLGVILKNENKLKEMAEILDDLNKYVPISQATDIVDINGKSFNVDKSVVSRRLLFGDQLTVARVRGASVLRSTHLTPDHTLQGFLPVVADWHARLCLVTVICNRLYCKSSNDWGTLFQLKQLINRTSVGGDPKHSMKASEDFLRVVLYSYIVVAAKTCVKDMPDDTELNCKSIADLVVKNYIKISLPGSQEATSDDSVYNYTLDLMGIGMMWLGFHDAIREGDGERIIRYWKFLMVVFRKDNHYNYANEGLKLIMQSLILSPRKVMELKWSRCINTQGRQGKNIPTDLHMEHLNCNLKNMIKNLGSNVTPKTVQRASKAFGIVNQICSKFKEETGVKVNKPFHSSPSFNADLSKIVQQLEKDEVFTITPQRQYTAFPDHKPLLLDINWDNITEWIKEKIIQLDSYNM